MHFFERNTRRVEVLGADGTLQCLYFPKPVLCNYLTDITREKVTHLR